MQDASTPKATSAQFRLRLAQVRDEAAVRALMEEGGMGLACDWQQATVAVDEHDEVIGYVRIQQTDKGPHVAPLAVCAQWQGRGVGRALLVDAVQHAGCLKLVARGEVAGFYRALGCKETSFDEISGELEEDCAHCADRDVCKPVAFIMKKEDVDNA